MSIFAVLLFTLSIPSWAAQSVGFPDEDEIWETSSENDQKSSDEISDNDKTYHRISASILIGQASLDDIIELINLPNVSTENKQRLIKLHKKHGGNYTEEQDQIILKNTIKNNYFLTKNLLKDGFIINAFFLYELRNNTQKQQHEILKASQAQFKFYDIMSELGLDIAIKYIKTEEDFVQFMHCMSQLFIEDFTSTIGRLDKSTINRIAFGNTILTYIITKKRYDLIEPAIQAGVDVRSPERSPAIFACIDQGDPECIRKLLNACEVPQQILTQCKKMECTPGQYAFMYNKIKLLDTIASYFNDKSKYLNGESFLLRAVELGDIEMIRYLIDQKVNIDGQKNQQTPLQRAVMKYIGADKKEIYLQIIDTLIKSGANPFLDPPKPFVLNAWQIVFVYNNEILNSKFKNAENLWRNKEKFKSIHIKGASFTGADKTNFLKNLLFCFENDKQALRLLSKALKETWVVRWKELKEDLLNTAIGKGWPEVIKFIAKSELYPNAFAKPQQLANLISQAMANGHAETVTVLATMALKHKKPSDIFYPVLEAIAHNKAPNVDEDDEKEAANYNDSDDDDDDDDSDEKDDSKESKATSDEVYDQNCIKVFISFVDKQGSQYKLSNKLLQRAIKNADLSSASFCLTAFGYLYLPNFIDNLFTGLSANDPQHKTLRNMLAPFATSKMQAKLQSNHNTATPHAAATTSTTVRSNEQHRALVAQLIGNSSKNGEVLSNILKVKQEKFADVKRWLNSIKAPINNKYNGSHTEARLDFQEETITITLWKPHRALSGQGCYTLPRLIKESFERYGFSKDMLLEMLQNS